MSSLAEMTKLSWLSNIDWNNLRERPSAIPVHIASIDDTSYFDTFPDVQLDISTSTSLTEKLLIPTLTYRIRARCDIIAV